MIMTNARPLPQPSQRSVKFRSEAFGSSGLSSAITRRISRRSALASGVSPNRPSRATSLLLYTPAFCDQSTQLFEHFVGLEQLPAPGFSSTALQLSFQLL